MLLEKASNPSGFGLKSVVISTIERIELWTTLRVIGNEPGVIPLGLAAIVRRHASGILS